MSGQGELPAPQSAFWQALGIEPDVAASCLRAATVTLTTIGNVDAAAAAEVLAAVQALGVQAGDGETATLRVVLTDDYLRPELAEVNQGTLRRGQRWLLVKPAGTVLLFGPLFEPGSTGCWECLAQRLRANPPLEPGPEGAGRSALPSALTLAAGMAATEAARAIAGGEALSGQILSIDLATLDTRRHLLVRRPQCPACGDPAQAAGPAGAFSLQPRRTRFTADGGQRVCAPDETLRRFGHHESAITGIAAGLQRLRIPGDAGLVNIYATIFAGQPSEHGLGVLSEHGHLIALGKGVSDAQARASGLGEALERYSGYFKGGELVRRARYVDLGGDAIHPNACMCFSATQYARRDELNAQPGQLESIPVPFDETAEIDWAPVWSLTEDRTKYLPAAYCYFRYPSSPGTTFCRADSNGNAAGNTLEEAVLQGALELVERDAVAAWWYNRVQRPAVDLASFGEPYLSAVQELLSSLGREVWLLDLTNDLGIPTFVAVSRQAGAAEEDLLVGCGAHLNARLAVTRAVTELMQTVALLFSDDADKVQVETANADEMHWVTTATIANQPYFAPLAGATARRASDFPPLLSDDLLADVTEVRRRLEARGMEMLVLDQTRPDIGLPVVKVIVPGMRAWYPRFGPGRLYQVPVEMGWLQAPLAEAALNPIPVFL